MSGKWRPFCFDLNVLLDGVDAAWQAQNHYLTQFAPEKQTPVKLQSKLFQDNVF